MHSGLVALQLCFITRPNNSVAMMVAMLTGMLPSIRRTMSDTRNVIATIAAPKNLILLKGNNTPPITWVAPKAISTGLEKPYFPKNSTSCSIKATFVSPDEIARTISSISIIVDASLILSF